MVNLGHYISRAAGQLPDQEAVVCGDLRLTYREFDARTNRAASVLVGRGLRPADAVATYASNRAELVEVEVALYKSGLLRVPINFRLGRQEVAHILTDAQVQVLFVDALHIDVARQAVADAGSAAQVVLFDAEAVDGDRGEISYAEFLARGDDSEVCVDVDESVPCVLNFTSGSTGKLKAAVQTTGNRLANMRKRLMTPQVEVGPTERFLVAGPITHASGMGLLALMSRAATVVVMPSWSAELFFTLVAKERITSTFLVPTMLNMVLEYPNADDQDLSSLQGVRLGGAPVSPQKLRDAVALFGPILMQGYGQAETTSGVTILTPDDIVRGIESDPEILLSCGRAVFDTELRIVDDQMRPLPAGELGELVVRGPDCVAEYWHEPELSAETFRDGWVLTGDIAYMRPDGLVIIVDRRKDMIISGGFNIYCSEVEAALYEHRAVSEVCVVGVPDERWGESVKAVVVVKPGCEVSEDELAAFSAERLDRYKKPRSVEFVDALPVNRNGKIDRKAVRAPYWVAEARAV